VTFDVLTRAGVVMNLATREVCRVAAARIIRDIGCAGGQKNFDRTMADTDATAPDTPRTYAELRRAVEGVFLRGQREIDVAQVMVYWNTGDLIHRPIAHHGGRADYGLEVVDRLAHNFGAGRRLLYRCLELRRTCKILSARTKLLWAH